MNLETLDMTLRAETGSFVADLHSASKALAEMAGPTQQLGKAHQEAGRAATEQTRQLAELRKELMGSVGPAGNFANMLMGAGGIAAGALLAAAGIEKLKESVKQGIEVIEAQEAAGFRLGATMHGNAQAIEGLIAQIEKLNQQQPFFTKAQLADAQSQLAFYGSTSGEIEKLLPSLVNLSSVMGIDLHDAALKIGAALRGYTRGLKELGINARDVHTVQQLVNAVTSRGAEMQQAAAAKAETLAGKMAALKKELQGVYAELAENMLPAIDATARAFITATRAASAFFGTLNIQTNQVANVLKLNLPVTQHLKNGLGQSTDLTTNLAPSVARMVAGGLSQDDIIKFMRDQGASLQQQQQVMAALGTAAVSVNHLSEAAETTLRRGSAPSEADPDRLLKPGAAGGKRKGGKRKGGKAKAAGPRASSNRLPFGEKLVAAGIRDLPNATAELEKVHKAQMAFIAQHRAAQIQAASDAIDAQMDAWHKVYDERKQREKEFWDNAQTLGTSAIGTLGNLAAHAIKGGLTGGDIARGVGGLAAGVATVFGGPLAGAGVSAVSEVLGAVFDQGDAAAKQQNEAALKQMEAAKLAKEAATKANDAAQKQVDATLKNLVLSGKNIDDQIARAKLQLDVASGRIDPKTGKLRALDMDIATKIADEAVKAGVDEARARALKPGADGRRAQALDFSHPTFVGGGSLQDLAKVKPPPNLLGGKPATGSTAVIPSGPGGNPVYVPSNDTTSATRPQSPNFEPTISIKPSAPSVSSSFGSFIAKIVGAGAVAGTGSVNAGAQAGENIDKLEELRAILAQLLDVTEKAGTEAHPMVITPPRGNQIAFLDANALMGQRAPTSRAIDVAGNARAL